MTQTPTTTHITQGKTNNLKQKFKYEKRVRMQIRMVDHESTSEC